MSHTLDNDLLESLTNCANACNYCKTACLEEADVAMMAECIKLDIDCAPFAALPPHLLPVVRHMVNTC